MNTKLVTILIILAGTLITTKSFAEEQKRDVTSFSSIVLNVPAQLYFEQGNTRSVKIEAPSSTLDEIVTEVKDHKLIIRFKEKRFFLRSFSNAKIVIHITNPDIDGLEISGSGDFVAENDIKTNDLNLIISGSGSIKFGSLDAGKVGARISGSGNIVFDDNGSADSFSISVSGSGKIKASNLEVKDVSVKVSGSGNSTVYATDNLDVHVSGSGDVYYRGRPNVNSQVSGSGKVRKLD